MKTYKILGKRGRITIPIEIRKEMGFAYNDVISFERNGSVVHVCCEKICDGCKNIPAPKPEPADESKAMTLTELLDSLTPAELRAALIHLSVRWAELTKAGDGDA